MPSPLPGMDPYLEQPAFWSSFHSRLIVAIADAVEPNLPPEYYIEVEARTYLDDHPESVLIGIPDMVVVGTSQQEKTATPSSESAIALQTKPQSVEVPVPEDVTERYLEIRELETGDAITAIELLSPKNKRPGKGRTTYEEKRTQVLGSSTNLVELDLLRAGASMPLLGNIPSTPYRILVSPSQQRPKADLYGFGLSQPLPNILIPLKPQDTGIPIALQSVFNGVYDRGRYYARIDYTQAPPAPPLSDPDKQWLDSYLQTLETD